MINTTTILRSIKEMLFKLLSISKLPICLSINLYQDLLKSYPESIL